MEQEGERMKNFEAVRQMNAKELAYTFYLMIKPFLGNCSEDERKAAYSQIEQWLMQDVPEGKKVGK